MNVGELIERLKEIEPETLICVEIKPGLYDYVEELEEGTASEFGLTSPNGWMVAL